MKRIILLIAILYTIILLSSCKDIFEYSPYLIDFDEDNSNVNQRNILKLAAQDNPDSIITIAFTGDTHREFDEFSNFVSAVNLMNDSTQIDFLVHVGDIADFGLPKQYLWGNSFLLELNIPYVVVLGNHDLVGNGGDAYHTMFGDYHYSFIYEKVKFIVLNTNSLEFGMKGKVPDISWMDAELKPNSDFNKAVVFFHISPTQVEFDSNLKDSFSTTLSKYNNVLFAAHGHTHHYSVYTPFSDSITYVDVYALEFEKFNVIKIKNDEIEINTYAF